MKDVQPVHVAAYIEELQGKRAAPTGKQHLACIRTMFEARLGNLWVDLGIAYRCADVTVELAAGGLE